MTDPVDVFERERPRLVAIAYRTTGSVADAEDVVQEAWIRWSRTDSGSIDRPAAWLTTATSRLALDRLRSRRRTREDYVGPWLPEPVATGPDPAADAELAESLTVGFLALLERLGPTERVVLLLADVFGLRFDEVAGVVDKTPDACRQIASRARRRIRDGRPRFEPTDEQAWELTVAFLTAAQGGDTETLLQLLDPAAVAVSDGGPHHRAARRPVVGAARVARFVANLAKRPYDGLTPSLEAVNTQPALVYRDARGRATMAIVVEVTRARVSALYTVLNDEKLRALDAPSTA